MSVGLDANAKGLDVVIVGAADLDGMSVGAGLVEVVTGADGVEDFALMALASNVTDRFFGLESCGSLRKVS